MDAQSPPTAKTEVWEALNFRHPHSALGAMAWLMQHSSYHRRWSLHAVSTDIANAIVLEQFRIYHTSEGEPVGFVTWANISEDVKNDLINRRRPMKIEDWRSGTILLFNDFVAPFGHGRWIINDLRCTLFVRNRAISLRRDINGSVTKIFNWHGKDFRSSK